MQAGNEWEERQTRPKNEKSTMLRATKVNIIWVLKVMPNQTTKEDSGRSQKKSHLTFNGSVRSKKIKMEEDACL